MNYKNNKFPNLASQSNVKTLGQDNMKERINTLTHVISSKLKAINGLIFRNKGRGLIGLVLKLVRGVRPRASKSVVKQVSGFCFRCYRIASHSGLKGLVLYLKACQVLLQQSVGGYRVVDLGELKVRPKRNRSGVPLIIPAGVRVLISQKRDPQSIKLWMTLLGLYRILEFKGTLSLNTITDKGTDLEKFLPVWKKFIKDEFKPNLFDMIDVPDMEPLRIFPILKSGPIYKIEPDNKFEISFTNASVKSLVMSARTFLKKGNTVLLKALTEVASQTIEGSSFLDRLKTIALVTHPELDLWLYTELGIRPLGRLGFKSEPAGKVRVFAMVDAWTQWLLCPLHKWLFQILDQIPQDGTFNQLSPITRLQEIYGSNLKGQLSSIDLSAATDRLPIELQIIILEVLLEDLVPDSASFAKAWADLLVKREYLVVTDPKEPDFYLPSNIKLSNNLKEDVLVSYSVGQPMGALSSWAMLAMTHHAMMQFAASKHSSGWFSDYAVLGDDGVIKGKNPSNSYISLLKTIGVKAGLAKSILASNRFVIEFAKKFFVDQSQANMLPFKECVATWASTSLVNEFVRKYDLSLNAILSFLGYGYKVKSKVYRSLYFNLPTRLRVLLIWLSHPNGTLGKEYYVDWLFQKSWTESFTPSEECMKLVLSRLEEQNNEKLDSIKEVFDLYQDSLRLSTTDKELDLTTGSYKTVDTTLDKLYPIFVTTMNARTENTFKVPVPWKSVLSPDLEEGQLNYESLTGSGQLSSETGLGDLRNTQHWTLNHKKLRELDIGLDLEDIVDQFRSRLASDGGDLYADQGPLFEGPCWGGYHLLEVEDKIDIQCQYFFQLDELKGMVPKKFWGEDRDEAKPFRDFLSIYKYWQDVTKPLWAEFYGKEFKFDPIKPEPKIARGDTEELVIHPPMEPQKGFRWVEFLIGIIISFFGLDYIYNYSDFNLDSGFHYTKTSSESEIFDWGPIIWLSDSSLELEPIHIFPLWGKICLGIGAAMLLGNLIASIKEGQFYDLSWYFLSRDCPVNPEVTITPVLHLDTVMVGTMRLSGPISAHSLDLLRIHMENRALLENLAISPIGALWELPSGSMTPITSLLS